MATGQVVLIYSGYNTHVNTDANALSVELVFSKSLTLMSSGNLSKKHNSLNVIIFLFKQDKRVQTMPLQPTPAGPPFALGSLSSGNDLTAILVYKKEACNMVALMAKTNNTTKKSQDI